MNRTELVENDDQRALRLWITAGLEIPEVTQLHGDAGYLLNNMIAKYTLAADTYTISARALSEFQRQGIDLGKTHKRSRFYGKKSGFMYEHAIPAGVVRSWLLSTKATCEQIRIMLGSLASVTVLLRSEDAQLREAGLNAKMPEGWQMADNPFARYDAVGIALSDQVLRVSGAICR